MPELPEVETIRRQLEEYLVGKEITQIIVRDRMVFVGDESTLAGEVIERLSRAGKYLFVYFRSGRGLGIHLKMTGRMIISKQANEITSEQNNIPTEEQSNNLTSQLGKNEFYEDAKHTRISATLSNGTKVYYWDTRRFGYWKIWESISEAEVKTKKALGPDPWEADQKYLHAKFIKTNRPVKEVILDQSILAGVGNIYANDGLWLAGIDPRRKAKSLKPAERKKLLESILQVMERGLVTGGASDNTYVDALGQKGSYQDEFLVYRRKGEPCRKCGTILERIVVGGRGSWVCEKCQR